MPTITLNDTNTAIQDTFVTPNAPTANYGTLVALRADAPSDEIYIKFNFGLIPNDAVITSAILRLTSYNNYGDVDVSLYDVLSPWEEPTVTWNTKPTTKFEDTFPQKGLVDGTQVNIPVTSLVQRMVKTGEAKHGFCLKGSRIVAFYSKDGGTNTAYRPKLEITYSIPETGKKQVEKVGFSTIVENSGNVRERTITLPAGTQQGDFMVLSVTNNAGEPPVLPVGWTALDAGSGQNLHTYYKFAGDNEDSVLMSYSVNRNFCASIYTYRNVKNIRKVGKSSGTSALALLPGTVSVPSAGSLVAITVSVSSNYSTGGKPNVAKEFEVYGGRGLSNFTTYNHEKTSYANSELGVSIYTSTAYEVLGYSIEPIVNTAPNTPPTNNPKGTADTPAILSVSTPKLDWSFSDSDPGDAQMKYQVRIKKASDNSIVHDTGVVTSAVTDYDVPAGVIQKNTLYYWEVQTYDSAGVSSSWSSPEYFKLTDQASVGDKFTFNYTGAPQFFTVPGNVLKVKLEAWGAQGGNKIGVNSDPGKGGYAKGELTVTAGELLNLYVGGKGIDGVSSGNINSPGGWNGGGAGGKGANHASGGGGGASDIRKGGTTLADRIIVAGGGGGISGAALTRGPYGGGLEGLRGNNGTSDSGGYGGTQSAGGAGLGTAATNGALGIGGNGDNNTSNSYGGGGGGGGYYGGGGGSTGQQGGGGSSYLGTLANAETTAGLREGDGLITITVLETSSPPTVTSRAPGSTDQTNPAGSSAAPLFSWDYSGAFTQAKYQIKIFNAQGTLAHDTGLITSSAKQHQMAEGVLTAGEVYGWELTVTDDKNVSYPTGRLYIITNRPPEGLTPISPEDRRRTTLLPVFEATIGDDVENDPQHFIIQLAENSDFTAGLIERKTSTDVTGWEVKESDGGYVTFPAEGADASFEFGSVKYSLQTPLTEGKTYYWRIAGMDAVTGARGNWSEVRRIRAGDKIDFSLRYPVKTSAAIQRLLIRAQYTLATDGENPAKVRFEACNNAFDENPVWEDVTKAIQSGDYYKFANTEKTADDWGFNIRALFEANDSLDPIEFYGFGISFD
ncbi:DNRLRE domain-containing protein [Bacillus badius]|uniref:glycine-rich protein n=1 Tax=Bacillus badius TaxID=1455 RepID=UPI001CBCF940|nr:glycine-rich protein [Bacillus badius]UAT31979.1 DNRLRE domain-containing protein [Bacillus badius]